MPGWSAYKQDQVSISRRMSVSRGEMKGTLWLALLPTQYIILYFIYLFNSKKYILAKALFFS